VHQSPFQLCEPATEGLSWRNFECAPRVSDEQARILSIQQLTVMA
jgi:hypothetical protein